MDWNALRFSTDGRLRRSFHMMSAMGRASIDDKEAQIDSRREETVARERKAILISLACAAVLLVIMTVLAARAFDERDRQEQWLIHSHKVSGALESFLSLLKDAETGQRGFLLTAQSRYLEPYQRAVADLPAAEKKLEQLLADNPEQIRRMAELKQYAMKKLRELERTIELGRQDPQAAMEAVLTDRGQQFMDESRRLVAAMMQTERDLLLDRTEMRRASIAVAVQWLIVFLLLTLLLIGAAGMVIYRSRRALAQETALRETEESWSAEMGRVVSEKTDALLRLEVTEQTLREANKELEAFSYSVSHDLRAPLRSINGFAKILVEDFGPSLPPEAKRHLHIIQKGAGRMGELIDDLLEFSRLSRSALDRQAVDLERVIREVWSELRREDQVQSAELAVGDLPRCRADRRLIKQVWVNLLSNALKYSRPRQEPRIEIGWREDEQQPGNAVYWVRDNGVGFDQQYVSKLFGVFQRLHRAEDFEGTGVGLALVRRIVQRHGGRVWAEGRLDEGATFYFTLARVHEHDGAGQHLSLAGRG